MTVDNTKENQNDFDRTIDEQSPEAHINAGQKLKKLDTADTLMQTGTSIRSTNNADKSSILPDGNEPVCLGSGTIDGLLGEGGMARVYRIWNSKLEMFRAVKIMLPTDRSELIERFETEIKISAKLHHTNIVETYSVGEWNGLPYLEMELIEGTPLDSLINKTGGIPIEVSLAIGIQIAKALQYAHSQEILIYGKKYKGIIHRDLKPANIMISKNGTVKLMDFGIARPTEVSFHTVAGNVVGTLPYLSPEQLDGEEIDHRSDIYSIGTILYEMLTGEKTFPQQTITNLMKNKSINKYRKFDSFSIKLPDALEKSIEKCLDSDRNCRHASSANLEDELFKSYHRITSDTLETTIMLFLEDPNSFVSKYSPNKLISKKFQLIAAGLMAVIALIAFTTIRIVPFHGKEKAETIANVSEMQPDTIGTQEKNGLSADSLKHIASESPVNTMVSHSVVDTNSSVDQNALSYKQKSSQTSGHSMNAKKPALKTDEPKQKIGTHEVNHDKIKVLESKYGGSDPVTIGEDACRAGNYSGAISALEMVPSDHPRKKIGAILLAYSYLETNKLSRASAIMQSIQSEDALAILIKGRIALAGGNYLLASESFETALARPSEVQNVMSIRGDALYYIALTNDALYSANSSPQTKQQALLAWNNLKRFYNSHQENPRFKLADQKVASLMM
jgi:serine/threonine protein kinase